MLTWYFVYIKQNKQNPHVKLDHIIEVYYDDGCTESLTILEKIIIFKLT